MGQGVLLKRLAASVILALAATGTVSAAVPPGGASAAIRRPPADVAHFAITAPILLQPPPEVQPDGDDPLDDEGPDEPIALWLFGVAAMILPVSGIGAGIVRHLPRRRAGRAGRAGRA